MEKLELDLELILPPDADARDACAARIAESLKAKTGITDVHIETRGESKPVLCLHYDPGAIRLDRVRWLVEEAGAELAKRFEHLSVPVMGLRHERQARLVEDVLRRESGVLEASSRSVRDGLRSSSSPARPHATHSSPQSAGLGSRSRPRPRQWMPRKRSTRNTSTSSGRSANGPS